MPKTQIQRHLLLACVESTSNVKQRKVQPCCNEKDYWHHRLLIVRSPCSDQKSAIAQKIHPDSRSASPSLFGDIPMNFSNLRNIYAIALTTPFLLSACGGGDGGSELQTAEHCFDETVLQPNNAVIQNYLRDGKSGPIRIFLTKSEKTNFAGQQNLTEHVVENGNLFIGATVSSTQHRYISQESPHVYKDYGYITKSIIQGITHTATYSTPVVDKRALLQIGNSLNFQAIGQLKIEKIRQPSTEILPINDSYTITYMGDSSILIGDRKVNSCKFKIVKNEIVSHEWIYKSILVQVSDAEDKVIVENTEKLTLNNKDY